MMAPPGAIFFRAISLRLTPHCKFLYVHTPTTFNVTTLHFFVQKVVRVKNEIIRMQRANMYQNRFIPYGHRMFSQAMAEYLQVSRV